MRVSFCVSVFPHTHFLLVLLVLIILSVCLLMTLIMMRVMSQSALMAIVSEQRRVGSDVSARE